jgi:glyoxylase-like metal-dependent hydrolase (beta-lactamase superfamily II)
MLSEIVPGIYQIQIPMANSAIGRVNSYLVEGKGKWTLIDTGWNVDEAFDSLNKALAELGLQLNDVETVLITHMHVDHFGMVGRIKRASPNIQVLVHHRDSVLIGERYLNYPEFLQSMTGLLRLHGLPDSEAEALEPVYIPSIRLVAVALPDRELSGGELIKTGRFDLEAISTPGHSPGHMSFYEPASQILFSGDHILPRLSPSIGYEPHFLGDPLGDYLSSLHELMGRPVTKVLPGHGNVFFDMSARIQQILAHHDARRKSIVENLKETPLSAWKICSLIQGGDPSVWNKASSMKKRITFTEVICHLVNLEKCGRARRLINNGMIYYLAAG